eukprot:TRINITY_DN18478_c0_g1_i1.p2 TRINITY_DN18478_c0_g1~~TRINITY_DN18478_c0_g1_i1.p2  ORF type:complete len:227 (-),score=0.38 TRINITY_DN18478_c0_g1_i1:1-681(-)
MEVDAASMINGGLTSDYDASVAALKDFGSLSEAPAGPFLNPALEAVVNEISSTGLTRYPWSLLKPLISAQIARVLGEFSVPAEDAAAFEASKQHTVQLLDHHQTEAPFTIQRLVELLFSNRKQYKSPQKYLHALEKVLNVRLTERCMTSEEFSESVRNLVKQKQEAEASRANPAPPVDSQAGKGTAGPMEVETSRPDDTAAASESASSAEKIDVMDIEAAAQDGNA